MQEARSHSGAAHSRSGTLRDVHANTVRCRLRRFEELTGVSPDAADTVVELSRAWRHASRGHLPRVRRHPLHERAGCPP
ncbi:helix-turn-helix domain-containing protein [Streptomyces sp. KS_5]|uniref:helix-turn-helix domain-containing protein n=1 Tax=Streptomyces TaxID=1883 RepID=UPI000B864CF0